MPDNPSVNPTAAFTWTTNPRASLPELSAAAAAAAVDDPIKHTDRTVITMITVIIIRWRFLNFNVSP